MKLFRFLNIKYILKVRNCKKCKAHVVFVFAPAHKYYVITYEVSVTKMVWIQGVGVCVCPRDSEVHGFRYMM